MYECDHWLIPIVYGYMYGEVIDKVDSNEVVYGGVRRFAGAADWFCNRCLEDVIL